MTTAMTMKKAMLEHSMSSSIIDAAPSMTEMDKASQGLHYHKILRFFSNPDTADLHNRQLGLLRRVARHGYWGYRIADLGSIAQLLDLTHERVHIPDFESSLCILISLAGKPFIRHKANEELLSEGQEGVHSLLASLSRLISSPSNKVKVQVTVTLRKLTEGRDYLRKNEAPNVQVSGTTVREDLRPLPKEYNNAALLRCGLVEAATTQLIQEAALYHSSLDQRAAAEVEKQELIQHSREVRLAAAAEVPQGEDYDEFWDGDDVVVEEVWGSGGGSSSNNDQEEVDKGIEARLEEVSKAAVSQKRIVVALLLLLREFSYYPQDRAAMVQAGAMDVLVDLLQCRRSVKDVLVPTCIDILWNCLDSSAEALRSGPLADSCSKMIVKWRKANAIYRLGNRKALEVLMSTLAQALKEGYRSKDKELRNALVIILSFISRNPSVHPAFHETRLVDLLLQYATVTELNRTSEVDADPHNYATTTPLDLEFKRLLWGLLSNLLLGKDSTNAATIVASPLLEVLVKYLKRVPGLTPEEVLLTPRGSGNNNNTSSNNNNNPATTTTTTGSTTTTPAPPSSSQSFVSRIPENQLVHVQKQALATLVNLVPLNVDEFQQRQGLELLISYIKGTSPTTGQRSECLSRAVRLLESVVGLPSYKDTLGALGTAETMLGLFLDGGGSRPEPLRLATVRILATLTSHHPINRRSFREAGGIRALIDCLKDYIRKRWAVLKETHQETVSEAALETLDEAGVKTKGMVGMGSKGHRPSSLMVSVVDCLWDAVVGEGESEGQLLDEAGMEVLLDLVECCPQAMRYQVLGMLSDLLQNPISSAYAACWRSNNDLATIHQLLLRLWLQEEWRLRLTRPQGVIYNLQHPLHSHDDDASKEAGGEQEQQLPQDDEDDEGTGTNEPTTTTTTAVDKPAAFARLQSAIRAASGAEEEAVPPPQDFRPRVAFLLRQLHGDGGWVDKISSRERMTLYMAHEYQKFREAEAWEAVLDRMEKEGKGQPIAADLMVVQRALEDSLNAAKEVKNQQKMLAERAKQEDGAELQLLLKDIIVHRDQEIHQIRLKRHMGINSSKFRMGPRKISPAKAAQLRVAENNDPDRIPNSTPSTTSTFEGAPEMGEEGLVGLAHFQVVPFAEPGEDVGSEWIMSSSIDDGNSEVVEGRGQEVVEEVGGGETREW